MAIGRNLFNPTGNVRVGFLLDNAFVAGRDVTFDAANYTTVGTFKDYTFSFDAVAADAGKTLKIYLGHSGGSDYYGFDNVRLNSTVAAVPEPSTWAMMALGVGALGLTLRRKRDVAQNSTDLAGVAI